MKFGRTLGYSKKKVKFEFDTKHSGRTRTSSNRKFKISITQKVMSEFVFVMSQNKALDHFKDIL